jgi:hypothetical protein
MREEKGRQGVVVEGVVVVVVPISPVGYPL